MDIRYRERREEREKIRRDAKKGRRYGERDSERDTEPCVTKRTYSKNGEPLVTLKIWQPSSRYGAITSDFGAKLSNLRGNQLHFWSRYA